MPEGFKLRAHGRIKTRCILYYLGEQVSGTGSVRDISLAGWRIVGDHPVTEGTTLSLRIFLPTVQEPIHIDAATVQRDQGNLSETVPLTRYYIQVYSKHLQAVRLTDRRCNQGGHDALFALQRMYG